MPTYTVYERSGFDFVFRTASGNVIRDSRVLNSDDGNYSANPIYSGTFQITDPTAVATFDTTIPITTGGTGEWQYDTAVPRSYRLTAPATIDGQSITTTTRLITSFTVYLADPEGGEIQLGVLSRVNANGTLTALGVYSSKALDPNVVYQLSGSADDDDPAAGDDFWLPRQAVLLPCFVAGTLITTDRGDVPVESLRAGDLVVTRDSDLQPVRWAGQVTLQRGALASSDLAPIRIAAGALGDGLPTRDLRVSPQHRVLVRSKIAQRMFGAMEVLVAAKQLLALDGIEVERTLRRVTYVHLLFDRHEIVLSNGAETESLFTGPEALKAVGEAARAEIFTLFPELQHGDPAESVPARQLVSGRQGRRLALRHAQNQMPLIQ